MVDAVPPEDVPNAESHVDVDAVFANESVSAATDGE